MAWKQKGSSHARRERLAADIAFTTCIGRAEMDGKSKADEARPQIDRFREAARELGTDESEERFREAVKTVTKTPYTKRAPKTSRDKPPDGK